jgi:nucleoside-diphosphate-sugar epimerase
MACKGDLLSSIDILRRFADGADVLYHCAAELHNSAEMVRTNVQGTQNLAVAANGVVGRWVQLSSTGIYHRIAKGPIDENALIMPANPYESSKAAADRLLSEAIGHSAICHTIVRPSNIYGIDMGNQSLFQLIRMIDRGRFFFIGRPGATMNYIHVENIVDALVLCGTTQCPVAGREYIVSDHRTIEEFVQIIAATLGTRLPRFRLPEKLVRIGCKFGKVIPGFPLSPSRIDALTGRVTYCTGRIQNELGYKQTVSMEAGIAELVREYKRRSASD